MTKEWKLTSYDRFCLKMVIRGAWFFTQVPPKEVLEKATERLIALYPQLGGHYHKKADAVVYDSLVPPAILPVLEADLRGHRLEEFREDARRIYAHLDLIRPGRFLRGRQAAFRIHRIRLDDAEGLAMECAHCLMDGLSFHRLTQTLGALCRDHQPQAMPESQGLIEDIWKDLGKEETIRACEQAFWKPLKGRDILGMLLNLVRSRTVRDDLVLRIRSEEVQRERQRSGAGTGAVLTARLLRRIAPLLPRGRELQLAFTVNLRGRLDSLTEDLMGNYSRMTALEGTFDGGMDQDSLSRLIRERLDAALEKESLTREIRLQGAVERHHLRYVNFDVAGMMRSRPSLVYINNQLSLSNDQLDLGTGQVRLTAFNDLEDMVKLVREGEDYLILLHGDLARLLRRSPERA